MNDFIRSDRLFSLCGLNCGLCSMQLGGYCPGCGGGAGNQPCKIAKCSEQNRKVEYCSRCIKFPCEKYEEADEYDSFITHINRFRDLEKMSRIGREAYQTEQIEKVGILKELLENYNDGRKKTFFCLTVNLLELTDLKEIMGQMKAEEAETSLSMKEKAALAAVLFQERASKRNITLKLRKPVKNKEKPGS